MKKGKVKYILKNDKLITEYEGNCLFYEDKNILVYKEKNDMDVLIELDRLILTRENNEMYLLLDFLNGESFVDMKTMDRRVPLFVTVYNRRLENNRLELTYSLSDDNKFEFIVEWDLDGE